MVRERAIKLCDVQVLEYYTPLQVVHIGSDLEMEERKQHIIGKF